MATLAFEPLCGAEEPSRDPAAAMSCFPFSAPNVEREMAAQCRAPVAEGCSGGKSSVERQPAVCGRSLRKTAAGEHLEPLPGECAESAGSAESADELLLLDWIIDGSCSTDDSMLCRAATADRRSASASDSFASPSFPSSGIGGNLSHSPLRASASERNLGGLCGGSRGGKREFRRTCSMEDLNSSGCDGANGGGVRGGGRGSKPGSRIHLETSPSSVLTGGPSSPVTSVDSCVSDFASPISSPVITEKISARRGTLHLPPLPPKAPVLSDSSWRTIPAISGLASCAPPTLQVQPFHQIRSFGAPQHADPSALPPPMQPQQRDELQGRKTQLADAGCRAGEAQAAQVPAKQYPLVVLDEQRRKHRAWVSLFSPSLAQNLPPLEPSESGAELKKLVGLRAPSAANAEAEQHGNCTRESNATAEAPVSQFCAEFPPFWTPAVVAGQPGSTSDCFAIGNSSDELAGDVTQAIRQGLESVKLDSVAGSSSGQGQNFSRSFSYDVTSCGGGLPNRNSYGIRRTSSEVWEAPADGMCTNGNVTMTKPSNLRRAGMAKQGQKKVRWGADEVFEIPSRCSSIIF
ncbi:unnamed protein product [Closterium sp. NIES-53]